MIGERSVFEDTIVPAADLSTHQYKIVKLTSTGVDVAAANEKGVGVLQNNPVGPSVDKAAHVMFIGISQLVVNAASPNIAIGDSIEATTGGIGVQSTADKKNVIGVALEAATADGVRISVLLTGRSQSSL